MKHHMKGAECSGWNNFRKHITGIGGMIDNDSVGQIQTWPQPIYHR